MGMCVAVVRCFVREKASSLEYVTTVIVIVLRVTFRLTTCH